jgi:hypothetical protein
VNVHDLPNGHPSAVQPDRLQPFQFVNIARSLLCLPKPFDFLLGHLKLSFRHAMILASSGFVFISP